jgi:hypothetical protein
VSTLKAGKLQHPDAADSSIEFDASGNVTKFVGPSGGTDGQALLKSGTTTAWGSVGGKILQVVRTIDSTQRTTTSSIPTYVDVTGMSVTITPQFDTSAILVVSTFVAELGSVGTSDQRSAFQITDASNNPISGSNERILGVQSSAGNITTGAPVTIIGYATPATTSAVTYKLRFCSINGALITTRIQNNSSTGQMIALEVGA